MNMPYTKFWPIIILILFITSCVPQKELLYLQDKEEPDMEFKELTGITGKYILQPNDYLYIRVSSFDPKISDFFNVSSSSNMNVSQGNTMFMYMIDDDCNIDFPYAGIINLKQCNLSQAKDKIKTALKPYLKDANLIVRLGTNYFTILGEVNSPGKQTMSRDQITIFEAIGMAGDITATGKKRDIKIVRPTPGGKSTTYIVDLTDRNIVDSEYYYIYPNDLIYVRPMKAKQWGIGESFSLGVLSTVLSFAVTIIALTN
jgi:polysaccharide biosynthesis/export protein